MKCEIINKCAPKSKRIYVGIYDEGGSGESYVLVNKDLMRIVILSGKAGCGPTDFWNIPEEDGDDFTVLKNIRPLNASEQFKLSN